MADTPKRRRSDTPPGGWPVERVSEGAVDRQDYPSLHALLTGIFEAFVRLEAKLDALSKEAAP